MNNPISTLMFTTAISCLFLSCSQTHITFSEQAPEARQDSQIIDLQWLKYADAKADANLAIEKQDFTLLAIAGEDISFPGINGKSPKLQQQCGYRLLITTNATLTPDSELSLDKQLYQYAEIYNQLTSVACQKHNLSKIN